MDPLSQGVLGATLPQSFLANKNHMFLAAILGFLGGMAPDLDILIRSSNDPLLYLEFHRQFTHSLVFIPIGGLLVAFALFHLGFKKYLKFKLTYYYVTLGYGTHALLDSCTSYGTQLFWPFSNYRVAWNSISIIDPLFTLPLLVLMIIAIKKKSKTISRFALAYVFLYLLFGVFQRERAEKIGYDIASLKNHKVLSLHAKPSFGNLLIWKIVYETEKKFFTTAVRLGVETELYSGDSIFKLNLERDFPWLEKNSIQAEDVKRFSWFSKGHIARHPFDKDVIIDVRYSTLPNRIDPLWGIKLSRTNQNEHVKDMTFRGNMKKRTKELFDMLLGKKEITPRTKRDMGILSKEFDLEIQRLIGDIDIENISVNEFKSLLGEQIIILDVREKEEFDTSHIMGAQNIAYSNFSFEQIKEKITQNSRVVVYCSVGYRSAKVVQMLRSQGVEVYNLYGGLFEWVNQGEVLFDLNSNETNRVHAFNKKWSRWLSRGDKVY